jgi:SPP1 family predicted phage head-tail adaptor
VIHAGELRYPAVFKEPTVETLDGDTTVEPFVEAFEARVAIDPVGGTEQTIGDQVQAAVGSLVKMRYDPRVHERLIMYARGRVFEIMSVLNLDERDKELQLTCRELV